MTSQPETPNAEPDEVAAAERPRRQSLTPLQATVELVKRGRREFLPQLRERLRAQPHVWGYVGDLARQTERAWVELIGGTDELLKESSSCTPRRCGRSWPVPTRNPWNV